MSDLSDTNKRARPLLIDPDAAWVPLGKVLGVVAVLAGTMVWADRITQQLNGIEAQVQRLADEVHRLPETRDFRAWVKEFKALNPTIQVPPFETSQG